jgi:hypothetical protein
MTRVAASRLLDQLAGPAGSLSGFETGGVGTGGTRFCPGVALGVEVDSCAGEVEEEGVGSAVVRLVGCA